MIHLYVPPIETGDMISQPLQGHSGVIESFAFPPDVTYIVSGSDDNLNTIRV